MQGASSGSAGDTDGRSYAAVFSPGARLGREHGLKHSQSAHRAGDGANQESIAQGAECDGFSGEQVGVAGEFNDHAAAPHGECRNRAVAQGGFCYRR